MARFIDLSHEIHDGLITYPGLAAPRIRPDMTFDASHTHYAAGYEFRIDRIDMIANTGTYIDTPAHRIRNGPDLADLQLTAVAGLPVVVVRVPWSVTTIEPESIDGLDVGGMAVLFATGWDRHWATPEYGADHPHLGVETAGALVAGDTALVGIDSLNVDATADGTRPIHTAASMLRKGTSFITASNPPLIPSSFGVKTSSAPRRPARLTASLWESSSRGGSW